MGKAQRSRWSANVKSMEIAGKPREEVTAEEITFLKENFTSMGGLLPKGFNGGAFFTPTHVAKFIWDVLTPRLPKQPRILEPSVGSGVFLEGAPDDSEITALELDETSAKITSLIYPQANVIQGNAILHDCPNQYDLVIGNPPYGESIAIEESERDFSEWQTLKKTKGIYKGKSESVFVEQAVRNTKPGGYIALVLPMGISYANHSAKARQALYENCWQVATILLPRETFAHVGTTIPTQIIIVRKVPPNTPKVTVEKQLRSLRGKDIDFKAEFFVGQPPAYFAVINDIGYDKDGRQTFDPEWGSELDELVEDLADVEYELVRTNLYPHIPSWTERDTEVHKFFFDNLSGSSEGAEDAKHTYNGAIRWNEFTLGMGEEYEFDGVEYSSMDYGLQDVIVRKYYEKGGV